MFDVDEARPPERMLLAGFAPESCWLLRGFTPAMPDKQLSLALKGGGRVARLEQLRFADSVVAVNETSVPQRFFTEMCRN